MISERAKVVSVAYLVSDLAMTAATLYVAHTARRLLGDLADGWLGPVYPFERYLPYGNDRGPASSSIAGLAVDSRKTLWVATVAELPA